MKHIETVKSVVLISLIILSLSLTFSIWSISGKYEPIEQKPTVEIAIADKKVIEEIIKPYKLLFHFEEGLKGTTDSDEIDYLTSTLKNWRISNLELNDTEFNKEKQNAFLREDDRFTLFFQGEVPISVYKNVLTMDESSVNDFSFDRISIDWGPAKTITYVHFFSSNREVRHSAKIMSNDFPELLIRGEDYASYVEANPNQSTPFIAVPEKQIELIRSTSLEAKTTPQKYRDVLFNDPNTVTLSQIGLNNEEYRDDHALMSIDKANKKLHYVHPAAESNEPAIGSELLLETIDFMNEHSGWTDDYRYAYINPSKRRVEYQLYVHGLPVHSDTMPTKIEQVWGEDRIFRYTRPYYTLDLTIPFKRDTKTLVSGKEVAKILLETPEIDFNTIKEISPGYFMKQDEDNGFFILEPSWYYMVNDYWVHFSPEKYGGEINGLE